jgi:DNA repair exonuclease SbcCD ATPase subunit
MHNVSAMFALIALLAAGTAQAQTGKIICWKDKSGKTVGCGDKVPPEFQDNATMELNKRGVTINQTEAALTPEQKKARQAEMDRKKAEEQLVIDQRRRDKALLDTFSNTAEVEDKRKRDVQLILSNLETLQTNLKNADERQSVPRAQIEQAKKANKPIPQSAQDEFDRVEEDKANIQAQITQKRRDIVELNQNYEAMKKRLIELKGSPDAASVASNTGKPAAPPPAPTPSAPAKNATPEKGTAPTKK